MSLVDSIDHYRYPDDVEIKQNKFREFLWFCAGADLQLLRHCPQSERIKEEGIGGVVLATAVLAFLSSSYAFYRVFNPGSDEGTPTIAVVSSVFFGLVWSMIIFNLDRFIVSSGGHGDGTEKITLDEFLGAIPRLLMALIIGFTLSKPLEIRVMQSELDAILVAKQGEYLYGRKDASGNVLTQDEKGKPLKPGAIDTEKTRWDNEIKKLNEVNYKALIDEQKLIEAKIEEYRALEIKASDTAYKEAGGSANNRVSGQGPGWKDAKANEAKYQQQKEEEIAKLETWKKDHAQDLSRKADDEAKIAQDHDKKLKEIEYTSSHMGGLVNRIMWAHEEFPTVSWALTLLLLSIEVAPIFFKMMLRSGPYHYLTENQREIVAARYAVERKANAQAGISGQHAEIEIYHQANASLVSSLAHLNSEARLSQQALVKFEESVSQDINAHPEKYIQLDPSSKG